MIRVTDQISIARWELSESFSRASGPGGQTANKVETAVTLRFDAVCGPVHPHPDPREWIFHYTHPDPTAQPARSSLLHCSFFASSNSPGVGQINRE